MIDLEARLILLGYDRRWLTFGFLDPAILEAQHASYLTDDEPHSEHYRFASFKRYLADHSSVSDVEIDRYLELAELDPDSTMAGSALSELLMWPGLNTPQFERLAVHPTFEPLQRLVRRRRLVTSISTGPIDDALVSTCVASNDSVVQRALVSDAGVSDVHLDLVAREGCNQAVRNLATQRLHRRIKDSPN